MSETAQTIGKGTQFQLGVPGTPETWTTIAGVASVSFGSNKVDTIDTTAMDSAGNQRAYIGGLENPGDLTIKINYRPGNTSQIALKAAKDSTPHDFKVIYPGAVLTKTFSGIITSIDEDVPLDKLPTWNVKIQITGPVTEA